MAQSEINDNGGIDGRDVEVTVRDTEASADTAIQQMRSLVEEDNVHGLFGLDSSGVAQAVAPQAAQLQMPYMITHAATPSSPRPKANTKTPSATTTCSATPTASRRISTGRH